MQARIDEVVAALRSQRRVERERERDDAHRCVAGLHELRGLGDVLALHQARLHRLPHAGGAQCLLGALAVGRVARVGDGDAAEHGVGEVLQLQAARVAGRAPQHDAAERVGPGRAVGEALGLERARVGDVGGEIEIEGRALADLRGELARGAVHHLDDITRMRATELGDDLVERELEVGGRRHRDALARRGGRRADARGEREQDAEHTAAWRQPG